MLLGVIQRRTGPFKEEKLAEMFDAGRNKGSVRELPCHLVDPEVFFAEQPADVEYAKSLCMSCPIQEACLASAQDRREPWGVWGGQLIVQGEIVARKRPRGRPRKHPLPEPEIAPAVARRWELPRERRGHGRQVRSGGERAA
ncbi:Transcription factor WhiB [Microlunatus soli]|uniref:Transcriptional regulator WhiB n=2 Tax=Microlunatus soli TaxID=630515 RepID=A0A1H1MNM0_9ACTN|nr:Transcription factor WhiB [Microlunatus soli]